MKVGFLLIGLLLAGLQSAAAQERLTSKHLALQCAADERENLLMASRVGFCLGYIMGVVDTYRIWRDFVNANLEQPVAAGFCLPEDINTNDMRNRIVDYLAADPDRLNRQPYSNVVGALAEMYPCTNDDSETNL